MTPSKCYECKEEIRRKLLKKIKGGYYCSKCYAELRKKHREETIKQAGIGEELKELDRKIRREDNDKHRVRINTWHKENYHKKNPDARYNRKFPESSMPRIKGVKKYNKKPRSSSYLTLDEKRLLFGQLIKQGLTYAEASDRIKELIGSLTELRKEIKEGKKSELEANSIQQNMINDLYSG